MMYKRLMALAQIPLAVVAAGVFAAAATGGAAAAGLEECDGPAPVLNACIFDHYEAADAELNRVWRQVLDTIRPSDFMPAEAAREWRNRLTAAQRAWVTFKEEDCNGAVAYEWYGGSGANAAVGACLYEKTVARTADLRARYLDR